MNTDALILNALPAGTTFRFTNYQGQEASITRMKDGRWRSFYISDLGNLCSGGLLNVAAAARALDAGSEVRAASALNAA